LQGKKVIFLCRGITRFAAAPQLIVQERRPAHPKTNAFFLSPRIAVVRLKFLVVKRKSQIHREVETESHGSQEKGDSRVAFH